MHVHVLFLSRIKKMNITKQQYEIGKIINSFITSDEKFESYLLKAKINIISE